MSIVECNVWPKKIEIVNSNGEILNDSIIGPYDQGTDLTLICLADNDSFNHTSVIWYDENNTEIDSTFYTESNGLWIRNELILKNLTYKHLNAIYICRGRNGHYDIRKHQKYIPTYIQLDVNLRPSQIRIVLTRNSMYPTSKMYDNDSLILIADHPVEFECIATGFHPSIEIRWLLRSKNSQLIDIDLHINAPIIQFLPRIEYDGNLLICSAMNLKMENNSESIAIQPIRVYYKPRLTIIPIGDDRVEEGSDLRLQCRIEANPDVFSEGIIWIQDGQVVWKTLSNDNDYNHNNGIVKATKIFRKLTRAQNGSIYQCMAANEIGQNISEPFVLSIVENQSFIKFVDNIYKNKLFRGTSSSWHILHKNNSNSHWIRLDNNHIMAVSLALSILTLIIIINIIFVIFSSRYCCHSKQIDTINENNALTVVYESSI
ncbi:hypothetical protein DERF_009821 [Dermatophagoides farinae]|uniref:Ig-like domain-containing protein n=1 Tax=Dermatophagoides farinae TaxID=6954 RepID=A0A922HZY2_DERFA|nr:hypothetical protein DERF_009821 [Dermatophagoides farinae]